MHLESLKVPPQMSKEIEEETSQQSKCPAWGQLQRPKLPASSFSEGCVERDGGAEQESAAKTLAAQMIRGSTRQTASIKRGLLLESEILASYAEPALVNVLSVGFVIHPEAPHLGANPQMGGYTRPLTTLHLALLR